MEDMNRPFASRSAVNAAVSFRVSSISASLIVVLAGTQGLQEHGEFRGRQLIYLSWRHVVFMAYRAYAFIPIISGTGVASAPAKEIVGSGCCSSRFSSRWA